MSTETITTLVILQSNEFEALNEFLDFIESASKQLPVDGTVTVTHAGKADIELVSRWIEAGKP